MATEILILLLGLLLTFMSRWNYYLPPSSGLLTQVPRSSHLKPLHNHCVGLSIGGERCAKCFDG